MMISHNIIERMEESSIILPVLSKAFLRSDWCRFELFLAVKRGLQRSFNSSTSSSSAFPAPASQPRVSVLPVLLEDLGQDDVDGLVCAVLTTTTYLAWPGQGGLEEREGFWNTLFSVLQRGGRRERELEVLPRI